MHFLPVNLFISYVHLIFVYKIKHTPCTISLINLSFAKLLSSISCTKIRFLHFTFDMFSKLCILRKCSWIPLCRIQTARTKTDYSYTDDVLLCKQFQTQCPRVKALILHMIRRIVGFALDLCSQTLIMMVAANN